MVQNYLMINEATNVVDNVCLWDGNIATWVPPAGSLLLIQAATPAMLWTYDEATKDFVLMEFVGQGQIGFTWNGVACVTNDPKPPVPGPV